MMSDLIRSVYRKMIPYEWRYLLYKLRHLDDFDNLKRIVNHSQKGDFSLRNYEKSQSIFIHITKSAGTSVAKALYGELPYHYTAQQYRVIFGRKRFNQYYKYCFVRNPWDRLYSAFSYLKGGGWDEADKQWAKKNLGHINSFDHFLEDWLTAEKLSSHIHFWPQSKFLCDRKGNALIDDLYYFETIQEDFERIKSRLGSDAELAHINASKRVSYKDVYTAEQIDKVRKLYQVDIENFGYDFDSFTRKTICNGKFVDAK